MPEPLLKQGELFAPRRPRPRLLALDLALRPAFEEVGRRGTLRDVRFRGACTLDVDSGETRSYTESAAGDLLSTLLGAERVVGWNLRAFALRVLAGLTERDLERLPLLDLLLDLREKLGVAVKLDAVAFATLGREPRRAACLLPGAAAPPSGAAGDGLESCRENAGTLAQVYGFGRDHGHVLVPRWKEIVRVDVTW